MAAVVTLITGAADDSGFKGIGGYFQRSERVHFGEAIAGEVRFTRLDTGKKCAGVGGFKPHSSGGAGACLAAFVYSRRQATIEQQREFGALWQERARHLA